jgi:hypothetical protein
MININEWLMQESILANIIFWAVSLCVAAPIVLVIAYTVWYVMMG